MRKEVDTVHNAGGALQPQSVAPVIAASAAAGKKDVPIVFCADANYGFYLPVVVQSIIDNSSAGYHYHIIVFDCGMPSAIIDKIAAQISERNNFSFEVRDISAYLSKHKFSAYRYITTAAYGRFFIPELCGSYDKVIYADIDMVFNRDPAELMNADLGENYIGAVIEFAAEAERIYAAEASRIPFGTLNLKEDEFYTNSGFLLFNIPVWRERNLAQQCLQFFIENEGELLVQNAVNSVCRGKILYLSPAWNFSVWDKDSIARWREIEPAGFMPHLEIFARDYEASLRDSSIVAHFLGDGKPWHKQEILFADLWWRYAAETKCYKHYLENFAEHKIAETYNTVPAKKTAREKTGREVPIVFCADANYGFYLPVIVQSIIDNANMRDSYIIIIMDCGIKAEILDIVSAQISECSNFSFRIEDISSWIQEHNKYFREDGYLTKATYGRFAIPDLCKDYAKVIYADIDMAFNRDPADLMDIDLGGNYIGGVVEFAAECERTFEDERSRYMAEIIGLEADQFYINAGFLLFNIAQWRTRNLSEKCIGFLGKNKLHFLDQCAINHICKGKITYLPPQWNYSCWVPNSISRYGSRINHSHTPLLSKLLADWKLAHKSRKVVAHYLGNIKPWRSTKLFFSELWWFYAAKTVLYTNYLENLSVAAMEAGFAVNKVKEASFCYSFLGIPL